MLMDSALQVRNLQIYLDCTIECRQSYTGLIHRQKPTIFVLCW